MAQGEEWTEWHLTPRGWERGSERHDGTPEVKRLAPLNSVLTVRYHDYAGAPGQLRERRRSQDATAVERLLKEHGEAPRNL